MAATASASFKHYLSTNYLIPTTTSSGATLRCTGSVIETPNVTTVTATGVLGASALPNGFLLLNPGAATTLTLPTAVNILAAFTAAGNPLIAGDVFTVKFQNISAAHAVTFATNTNLTKLRQDLASVPAAAGKGGFIWFRARSVTVGAESVEFAMLMSNL